MTFEELHNYVSKQLGSVMQNEDDWRPAGDMYIEDIVHVIDAKYCTIPNGIRIWLNSGDSIIYVKAQKGRQNGMVDREKVVKALKCCHQINQTECFKCPYSRGNGCTYALMRDALALLKAQEPRVMTLEEASAVEVVWVEDRGTNTVFLCLVRNNMNDSELYKYGIQWRVWSARPTDEQRKETPWGTGMMSGRK